MASTSSSFVKSISTLIPDIYTVVDKGIELDAGERSELGLKLVEAVMQGLGKKEEASQKGRGLRMSNFGTPCKRKLWYIVNMSEVAEKLNPWTKIKFTYGHLLEQLALLLTKKAGHKVEGEQDEVYFEGIKGHRDAVVDGVLIDVKSANARGMDKFRDHRLESDDPFGYLDQLGLYAAAGRDDPLVEVKREAGFLVIDKELGHLVLDRYKVKDITKEEIDETKEMLRSDVPPRRHYDPIPDGKSGNYQLDMPCRYCDYKATCWPGLRVFLYSNGPRFLTRVVREPEVKEIT